MSEDNITFPNVEEAIEFGDNLTDIAMDLIIISKAEKFPIKTDVSFIYKNKFFKVKLEVLEI